MSASRLFARSFVNLPISPHDLCQPMRQTVDTTVVTNQFQILPGKLSVFPWRSALWRLFNQKSALRGISHNTQMNGLGLDFSIQILTHSILCCTVLQSYWWSQRPNGKPFPFQRTARLEHVLFRTSESGNIRCIHGHFRFARIGRTIWPDLKTGNPVRPICQPLI